MKHRWNPSEYTPTITTVCHTHTLYWPFLWYVFSAIGWETNVREEEITPRLMYIKWHFYSIFIYSERDSCLIFHLMEKEMVVLCGKILCIWIICVSSHPFSQLPPVCLFTHSSLSSSQPLCARFEMLFCSMCVFFSTAAADCFVVFCRFLLGF